MIMCSLKCFNFLQHGIIRMELLGLGYSGFWDHPLLSKPTKQTGKLALSPVWFRARLRMIVIKTEKLGSDLSEPSLTMEKINLRPNVLN